MPGTPLDDWPKGEDVRNRAHHQQPIDALKELFRKANAGISQLRQPHKVNGFPLLFGRVTDAGPNGEADYPDERVWVQVRYPDANDDDANKLTLNDEYEVPIDEFEDPVPHIVTATNPPDVESHAHSLNVDDPVVMVAVWDSSDQPGLHYLIVSGSSESKGQYYGQDHGMVSQNEAGWYFSPLVELPPT